MPIEVILINIDGSDENADWIKTAENRKTEAEIHRALAEEYATAIQKHRNRR